MIAATNWYVYRYDNTYVPYGMSRCIMLLSATPIIQLLVSRLAADS